MLASVRLERGGGPSQVLDKRVLRWPRRLAQQPPAGSAIYFHRSIRTRIQHHAGSSKRFSSTLTWHVQTFCWRRRSTTSSGNSVLLDHGSLVPGRAAPSLRGARCEDPLRVQLPSCKDDQLEHPATLEESAGRSLPSDGRVQCRSDLASSPPLSLCIVLWYESINSASAAYFFSAPRLGCFSPPLTA